ncbi:MAG: HD-GYP domain-containing protein [Desulfobulbus sp.]
MSPRAGIGIHRRILRRLGAFWLLAALAAGCTVFVVERHQLNRAVVALVAGESNALSRDISSIMDAFSPQSGDWRDRLLAMTKDHCLYLQIVDANRNLISEAVNAHYQDQAGALRELAAQEQVAEARPSYRKLRYNGETVVLVVLPLLARHAEGPRFFSGVFRVDQTVLARLEKNLLWTLGLILAVILLTALALYPLILSLNRDALKYSEQVLRHNFELISVLGTVIALRDSTTALHNYRVTLYALGLAEAAGLPPADMPRLILGAFLHDVGKIGISDTLLNEPGRLNGQQRRVMQDHVTMGMEIIRNSGWLQTGSPVIEYHHEHYDGTGYPHGLCGAAIPLVARIFAIVDVFDALGSERPYKKALPLDQCLKAIAGESGHHFDPALVAVFLRIADELYRELAPLDEAALIERLYGVARVYFAPFYHGSPQKDLPGLRSRNKTTSPH